MRRLHQFFGPLTAVVIGLSCLPAQVSADVKLPSVLGSNMVLQRDRDINVWGWADTGEKVTVSLGNTEAVTEAGADGTWKVVLPAHKAGGPHALTVKGNNTIELTNILVGDVWVCSGQSNMQWAVTQSNNPDEEVKNADHPQIRLFYIPRVPSFQPQADVNAAWEVCSPETVGRFSAVAYFFGRELNREAGIPIGLINTSWGGTRIEPWIPPVGFEMVEAVKATADQVRERAEKPPEKINQQIPGVLYNGMVHAIVPFQVKGAIWYQGESNRGEGMMYHEKMKALIHGWRSVWGNDGLPFYFVQLAPFTYGGSETALPEIWEAQTATLAVPHTGMAVTTDIGNIKDIHPRNKQEVGRRLALWALAKDYGKELVYSGPLYQSMKVEGSSVRLTFDHADGLKASDDQPLTHFTMAGPDGEFVEAKATVDGKTIVVTAEGVTEPKAVRFAWHQLAEPNLVNGAGLPASPFRTDK